MTCTRRTLLKAIREKCIDCMCGQANEVAQCTVERCALYPFRMGKNPFRTCNLSDEARKALSERAKAMNKSRISKEHERMKNVSDDGRNT